jgi:phage-related protein
MLRSPRLHMSGEELVCALLFVKLAFENALRARNFQTGAVAAEPRMHELDGKWRTGITGIIS